MSDTEFERREREKALAQRQKVFREKKAKEQSLRRPNHPTRPELFTTDLRLPPMPPLPLANPFLTPMSGRKDLPVIKSEPTEPTFNHDLT